jgi:hypothetical protein
LYCKILKDVIREAKRQHYNRQVSNSSNKTRIAWDIVRSVTGKFNVNTIQELETNGKIIRNRQNIKPLDYLRQVEDHSYPRIKYHLVTILELVEIINL